MWQWLKNFFKNAKRMLWSLIKEIVSGATELVLAQLQEYALEVIKELAQGNLTNEQRRQEAFKRIREYSIEKGLVARDSLINWLIETCVLKLKLVVEDK